MPDVRRPKEYEEMLYDMCQSEGKIFNSYKDAMVFASCLGYSKNEKTEFGKSSEPIGLHIFHAEFDEAIFYCLALAEKNEVSCLADDELEKRIKSFEEYAAAGLEIMKNRIYESNLERNDAVTELVLEQYTGDSGLLQGIASLAD